MLLVVRRRKLIAWSIATALTLTAPQLLAATTWTVNSCDEASSGSGTTGTLRYAANNAATGDTIDLSTLSCSTITLKTGAITFSQNDITLTGPTSGGLTITGKYSLGNEEKDRLFKHTGTGTLKISYVSFAFGDLYQTTGTAAGGCIYSSGTVELYDSTVASCGATTKSGFARGGAIYAKGEVLLKYSTVEFSGAYGTNNALGGGIYAGSVSIKYSTVHSNEVSAFNKTAGNGGGIHVSGNVGIFSSAITSNTSYGDQGGIDIFSPSPSGVTTSISNSTISGNTASSYTGGVYVNSGTITVQNSTIAFNTAKKVYSSGSSNAYAVGLAVATDGANISLKLESSLFSNNYDGSTVFDVSTLPRSQTITVTGNNNWVERGAGNPTLPSDTKNGCPDLEALKDNGGLTLTHALHSKSLAIDTGNNAAKLNEDQRGTFRATAPYPYPRTSGAATDIGAYEVQQNDIIFNSGFVDFCTDEIII